ncbi:MAG TPA: transcriptional repressor [Clostridiales bacterium]|jgi:Fe2+ or Zn2+ uptake regulation protein|nr:transcriptional repressor [Clostridiales bacterium]
MSISVTEVKEYLLKSKIKPSFPRLKIFEYLASNPTHPTVDDIHKTLVEEIPTLSKTTVYNTLDLFIRSQIVRPITIDGNELRYDVDVTTHGHFKCQDCGVIYEFDMDPALPRSLDGFRILDKNIYFNGVCPSCLAKDASASS